MPPNRMLISDVVWFTANRDPDGVALVFDDEEITFAQLHRRINQVANAIAELTTPGERVAILCENLPEYIECYYGVPRAGTPLVFVNYRLVPREVQHILCDSGASLLITESKYASTVENIRKNCPGLRHVISVNRIGDPYEGAIDYEGMVTEASVEEPSVPVTGGDLAWLIYTSGTTGAPKGAMLSHDNLIAAMSNSAVRWGSDVTGPLLFPWPLCHVAGYSILVLHLQGRRIVLMRVYEPGKFLAKIERYGIVETSVAPTMFSMLLRHPGFDKYDVSGVQRIGYGAAAMPAEVLRQGMARFPNAEFATGFGMTELSGNVLYHPPEAHLRGLNEKPELLTSVGQPMPLSMLRIVDEQMSDVGVDQIGELVVRGPQVTLGYWNNAAATEEAFGGGWFHSGDLAKTDDEGNVYIVDRKKDMILTGGENVYSREVEEVLYMHPAVAEAAVIGVPDPEWGENVVAVLQLRDEKTVTEADIREFCRGQLAGYKRPKRVIFVQELPRNAAGKILKRELRTQVADDGI